MINHLRESGLGVGPVCRELDLSESAYYARKKRPKPARQLRDEQLMPLIEEIHAEPGGTYGARRITRALRRKGAVVARCTVERLMAELAAFSQAAVPALSARARHRAARMPSSRAPPGRVRRCRAWAWVWRISSWAAISMNASSGSRCWRRTAVWRSAASRMPRSPPRPRPPAPRLPALT
ncbi:IS3 family transposase [Streptomyces sp. NPDC052042]|uniref:IS3 family transposase n=1 Tax=Streptomyces sp. NPDC052042 TaxID=3365683 RepID=UPI0037D6A7B3